MVFLGNGRGDNDLSSPPSGWTKLSAINNTNGDAASLIIAYKTATGSEGSTVDFTYDGSTGRPQARSYALRSFTGTPELTSTTANSASSVDPPTVTPSWGTDGAVFIAVMVCSKNATSVTGPTGYSTPVTVTYSGATATNMSLSTSHLSDTVSSENPSAYGIGTTRDALIAATIVVRGG